MRMKYGIAAAVLALVLLPGVGRAEAGFPRLAMSADGGGGPYINIIVREVRVTPVRAHVGDVIRIEMTVEDQGDLYYGNTNAEILANGKVVARRLVTYGLGGEGGRIRTETYSWDTRGVPPGEYRIEGRVFIWGDASPFDNSLDVKQPLVLEPPGASFPGGQAAGGTAVARDPRFRRGSGFASEPGESGPGAGGY